MAGIPHFVFLDGAGRPLAAAVGRLPPEVLQGASRASHRARACACAPRPARCARIGRRVASPPCSALPSWLRCRARRRQRDRARGGPAAAAVRRRARRDVGAAAGRARRAARRRGALAARARLTRSAGRATSDARRRAARARRRSRSAAIVLWDVRCGCALRARRFRPRCRVGRSPPQPPPARPAAGAAGAVEKPRKVDSWVPHQHHRQPAAGWAARDWASRRRAGCGCGRASSVQTPPMPHISAPAHSTRITPHAPWLAHCPWRSRLRT